MNISALPSLLQGRDVDNVVLFMHEEREVKTQGMPFQHFQRAADIRRMALTVFQKPHVRTVPASAFFPAKIQKGCGHKYGPSLRMARTGFSASRSITMSFR